MFVIVLISGYQQLVKKHNEINLVKTKEHSMKKHLVSFLLTVLSICCPVKYSINVLEIKRKKLICFILLVVINKGEELKVLSLTIVKIHLYPVLHHFKLSYSCVCSNVTIMCQL